jgi:hypothetical protein
MQGQDTLKISHTQHLTISPIDMLQSPNESSSTEDDLFDGTLEGFGNSGPALPPTLVLSLPSGNEVPLDNNSYRPEDIGEPKSVVTPEATTIILVCIGLVGMADMKPKVVKQISPGLRPRQLQRKIIVGEFSRPQAPA